MERVLLISPHNLAQDLGVPEEFVSEESYKAAMDAAEFLLTDNEKKALNYYYITEGPDPEKDYSGYLREYEGRAYSGGKVETFKELGLEKIRPFFLGEKPLFYYPDKDEAEKLLNKWQDFPDRDSKGRISLYPNLLAGYIDETCEICGERLCLCDLGYKGKLAFCLNDFSAEVVTQEGYTSRRPKHTVIEYSKDEDSPQVKGVKPLGDLKLESIIRQACERTEEHFHYAGTWEQCSWLHDGSKNDYIRDKYSIGHQIPGNVKLDKDPFIVSDWMLDSEERKWFEIYVKTKSEGIDNIEYNFHVVERTDENGDVNSIYVKFFDVEEAFEFGEDYRHGDWQYVIDDDCYKSFYYRSDYSRSFLEEGNHGQIELNQNEAYNLMEAIPDIGCDEMLEDMGIIDKEGDEIIVLYYFDFKDAKVFRARGAYLSKYKPYIDVVRFILDKTGVFDGELQLREIHDEIIEKEKQTKEFEKIEAMRWFYESPLMIL